MDLTFILRESRRLDCCANGLVFNIRWDFPPRYDFTTWEIKSLRSLELSMQIQRWIEVYWVHISPRSYPPCLKPVPKHKRRMSGAAKLQQRKEWLHTFVAPLQKTPLGSVAHLQTNAIVWSRKTACSAPNVSWSSLAANRSNKLGTSRGSLFWSKEGKVFLVQSDDLLMAPPVEIGV